MGTQTSKFARIQIILNQEIDKNLYDKQRDQFISTTVADTAISGMVSKDESRFLYQSVF
ncbi:hypothetical protein SS50377_28694 [Spironucleus salmonicida]|uniref:Uncharacterized protein n=1 Tax=Spironucleus salmonicida TaxID=348837 RepID=A0A9P8RUL0_9EUKA|nr:hypothetical protein SS50377_28694 [Spironucleus salmonicida]